MADVRRGGAGGWRHSRFVPLAGKNGFRVTARAVAGAITPRTRAVVVNSPSNPTGAVVEPDELVKIARLAKKHGFWLLYDDTYAHLVFRRGGPPRSRR